MGSEERIDPDEYDCVSCGACCVFFAGEKGFFPIAEDDPNAASLLKRGLAYRSKDGGMAMRRKAMKTHRRCIAVYGNRGVEMKCKCYETRPQTCRDFTPGSPLCLEARKAVLGHA